MPCPICGASPMRPSFRVAFPARDASYRAAWPLKVEPGVPHWVIARCPACGLHAPDPMPPEPEIARFYANQEEPDSWEVENYVNIPPGQARYWDRFAEQLTRLCDGPGRLIEIGCAAGHLLSSATAIGWDVLGVEASPKFAREVRRRALPVHEGTLSTLPPTEPADLIVMTDVLEHLYDPVCELERCHALLRPGGTIVIATCDIGSWTARTYRLRWRQLVPSHTFYWTRASLCHALHAAGFDVTAFSAVQYWDPDPGIERKNRNRAFGKVLARAALQLTAMPAIHRSLRLQHLVGTATGGWLDYPTLAFKVGDQPVFADVALVVGRSR